MLNDFTFSSIAWIINYLPGSGCQTVQVTWFVFVLLVSGWLALQWACLRKL
jgi:hypothetical protein